MEIKAFCCRFEANERYFFLIKLREGSFLTSPNATHGPAEYSILIAGDTRQIELHFDAKIMSLLACVVDLRLILCRDIRKSGL